MIGYIYFLEAENRLIKIGISKNLTGRILNLAHTNAIPLKLIAYIRFDDISMDQLLCEEGRLHVRFENDRLHGEWFNPSQKLIDFIDSDCEKDCHETNSLLFPLYNNPCLFRKAQKAKSKNHAVLGPSKKREGFKPLIKEFILSYPGSSIKKISKGIGCTVGLCGSILRSFENDGVVTKMKCNNRFMWYMENDEQSEVEKVLEGGKA